MRVAYLDCFSGASGDMLLGALFDAGINKEVFVSHLRSLGLPGFRLETGPVTKMGLRATQVRIEGAKETSARRLEDIFALFKASSLPPPVVEKATAVFQRLAEAEGRVHQQLPRDVHFHELGAADSIVDIVGTTLGFYLLEVERIYFSPLPLGRGMIESEHGLLPNPAPATLELLKGVPLHPVDAEGELVTPTGAALLTTLGTFVPNPPRMSVQAIGYGAGSREYPWPNVLRLWLGEMEKPAAASSQFNWETVFLLETVIDDMDPEWFPHLQEKLVCAGALDVWWTAVQMKKGRPGVELTALVREPDIPNLLRLILEESTTLGVRLRREQRFLLERREIVVETIYGSIKAKQVFLPSPEGDSWRIKPEFESCRRLAERRNLTLHEVYAAFWAAVQNLPLNDIF